MVRLIKWTPVVGSVIVLACLFGANSAVALDTSPWWQLSSASSPSFLRHGLAQNEVQEVTTSQEAVMEVSVGEQFVGFFLTEPYNAQFGGAFPEPTAKSFQEGLEAVYGAGNVSVTGGEQPQGMEPLVVTTVNKMGDQPVPAIRVVPYFGTSAEARVVTPGRPDGEITITAANLGDADLSGAGTIIELKDKLPSGIRAVTMAAIAGGGIASVTNRGPVGCSVESLTCRFDGSLPPYEELEATLGVVVEPTATSGEQNEVSVSGGNALPAAIRRPVTIAENEAGPGIESYELLAETADGMPATQAGSHPFQLTTNLAFNQATEARLAGMPKDLAVKLPAGLVGNVSAFPQCSEEAFRHAHNGVNECPADTAVGVAVITVNEPYIVHQETYVVPVFNLRPNVGEPARFGFFTEVAFAVMDTSVRTGGDYGVTVNVRNISEIAYLLNSKVMFWGVPGDVRHDSARGWSCVAGGAWQEINPTTVRACAPSGGEAVPMLTLPTTCAGPLESTVEADFWGRPGAYVAREADQPLVGMDGCDRVPFQPEASFASDSSDADTPTGLQLHVHVPQSSASNPEGLAESAVKSTTVLLPEGMLLSPAGANGLEACSEAEIGFQGREEETGVVATNVFTPTLPDPFCPNGAKIGSVKITTPLLRNALEGGVYIATPASNAEPGKNPFRSLVAMYIVAEDPVSGTLVKLPGKVALDPAGRISATFEDTPQLPFEDLTVHFFGGEHAPLTTPAKCTTMVADDYLTSWSGSLVTAMMRSPIKAGPGGGPCPEGSFEPGFTAEAAGVQAGAFTPFVVGMHRLDADQPLGGVAMTLPPGLLGTLSSVKLCPEPQAAEGLCGPESLIGHTNVRAGLGPDPIAIKPGSVYLTGPYKGAPFGLSIANPAAAGPFDLGEGSCDCIVVRAKVEVDPLTAQLKIVSDPLPTIERGIPLQLQDLDVTVDRPDFTFNPTDCNPMAITGTVSSSEGATANVSSRFEVANCATLAFKPKFKAHTTGRTSRKQGASLSVKLTYPNGAFGKDANLAKVKVVLPKQLPSRLSTLNKACPSTVFEANPASCPATSKVGEAKALTPVLPVPLEGPAYFVSYGNAKFPELVIVLQGYGVTVQLHGETFVSSKGITSSTFRHVPDVPIDSFELTLPQGPNSAFASGWNLCKGKLHMPTSFVAQNGMALKQNIPIAVSGCRKHKRAHKARHHRKH